MPQENVDFSAREHELLEQVAERLGLASAQEAAEFLAKQALAKRASRPVKVPGQVIHFSPRRKT